MQISNLATSDGPTIYYSTELRLIFEDHMSYLRDSTEMSILSVEPTMAYKYEGDLFGLLFHYNVPFEYHWIVMRVNKMTNPNQSKSTLISLFVPNRSVIERLKNVYMTKNRIVH
jgi:hypothetical protein